MVPTTDPTTYAQRALSVGPIFETVTVQGDVVSVALEPIRYGHGLIVRSGHIVIMAVPVAHVTMAVLATMFDAVDTAAIMARVGESK